MADSSSTTSSMSDERGVGLTPTATIRNGVLAMRAQMENGSPVTTALPTMMRTHVPLPCHTHLYIDVISLPTTSYEFITRRCINSDLFHPALLFHHRARL